MKCFGEVILDKSFIKNRRLLKNDRRLICSLLRINEFCNDVYNEILSAF